MERVANQLRELSKDLDNIPGVENFTFVTGNGILSGTGSNNGMGFFKLKPFEERAKYPDQSINAIINKAFVAAQKIKDAKVLFFEPPAVSGFGMGAGVSFVLLNKSGADATEINKTTQEFMAALNARPEVQYAL